MSTPVPAVPGRQHVEILTSTSSTQAPAGYGTGYVVAPRLILTARHVVADATAIHVRLGIEPGGPRLPATIAWSGSAGVDLALLELAKPVPHPVRTPSFGQLLALPEAATRQRSWDYRCTGFPALQQGQLPNGRLYRDSVTICGRIRSDWNLRTRLLTLAVDAIEGVEAADWKGMSGSPVFVHDWLVGVVVEASRHKHTLAAIPIAAALDDRPVNLENFIEPPPGRKHLHALLAKHGVPAELIPAHRRPYQDTLLHVAQQCPQLRDRGAELNRLRQWIRSRLPYGVWVGEPWSGKTSIAATLASTPPRGVDVISYFVSRARGASSTSGLVASLADQLAALLDEPKPKPEQQPEAIFDELFGRAVTMQQYLDRRLLVIVDGVDELNDRTATRALLARLPYDPPPEVSILLFTRPTVHLSALTDPQHAINRDDARDLVELTTSRHAEQSQHRAMADVDELFDAGGLAQRALECIAAVGPLAEEDIARVLNTADSDRDHLHRAVKTGISGQMLVMMRGTRAPRFAFAHNKLREAVLDRSDVRRKKSYQQTVAQLGDQCAADGWKDTTPDFFIHDYLTMLADRGDLNRLSETALSPLWSALQRRRTGADLDASTTLQQALAMYTNAEDLDLDLSALVPIGLRLLEINPRLRSYPHALIQAWVLAGRPRQARHRAQQLGDSEDRIEALTTLAYTALQDARLEDARTLLALAVQSALSFDADRVDRARQRAHEEHLRYAATADTQPNSPALSARELVGAEPMPAARTKVAMLLGLAPLAHQLGQLGLAVDINEAVWPLLVGHPDDTLPVALVLDAVEFALALADSGRPRAMLDRLDGRDLDASTAERRDKLHDAIAGRVTLPPISDRVAAPMPQPAANPLAPTAHDADWLDRIRACITRGDLNDAAGLVDDFRPRPQDLIDVLLGDRNDEVAALSHQSAQHHGPAALVVVEAAERFVARTEAAKVAQKWQLLVGSGAHYANSPLYEPAGTFLAQIVETMARHGQLRAALRTAPMTGPREAVELIMAGFAVGAARAGHHTTAIRLLHGARDNVLAHRALDQIAQHLATTNCWRNALDLVHGRFGWEAHDVTVTAIGTAIRSGAIQDGMATLAAHQDNPFLPGTSAAVAVDALADVDHWDVALELATQISDPGRYCATLLTLAEKAHSAGFEDAETLVSPIMHEAKAVELSQRIAVWTNAATVATRIGAQAMAGDAIRRAVHATHRLDDPAQRCQTLLSLATRADAGVSQDLARRLIAAATREARTLTNDDARWEALAETTATLYDMGDHATADDMADELLRCHSTGPCPEHLVIAAARSGRIDKARRLLRTTPPIANNPLSPIDAESSHYSNLARTAAAADLWMDVNYFVDAVSAEDRADLLGELAATLAENDVIRARHLVIRGLLTGLSPRLLSAATHLDHRVGPAAIAWFVRAARSGDVVTSRLITMRSHSEHISSIT